MKGTPGGRATGQRQRLLTIEQCTDTTGPSSFPVEAWTLLAQEWAAFTAVGGGGLIGGGEAFVADQVAGTATATWTIRYRADCDPELLEVVKRRRLVFSGRVFDIVAAAQIGRRQGLEFRTIAKVG
jgi:head-tail adaptor